jgi:hypothetical protein
MNLLWKGKRVRWSKKVFRLIKVIPTSKNVRNAGLYNVGSLTSRNPTGLGGLLLGQLLNLPNPSGRTRPWDFFLSL